MPRAARTEAVCTTLAVSLGALLLGVTFWSVNTDPMRAIISFVLVYDPSIEVMGGSLLAIVFSSLVALLNARKAEKR